MIAMQGQQERIALKKRKALAPLDTPIFAYYCGNKFIRVGKESIEICKVNDGMVENSFTGFDATKIDLENLFPEDKRPFQFLLALPQDEVVRIFFVKGENHYLAEIDLASQIHQVSVILKNVVNVSAVCVSKLMQMQRIGYHFIVGSENLSAFFLLSAGEGKEPLLVRCKMSKDESSFEEFCLWRNERNMQEKPLKNAFFSQRQLLCVFASGELRIYNYQVRSLSYDNKTFIYKALTEDIRLTKSINNARHLLISSARKGEVYYFLFLIVEGRSRYVLIQYCNSNTFKSIDYCKYQLRNLFDNEERVEISVVRQTQNQSWLVFTQQERSVFLLLVQPDKSIAKSIIDSGKDAHFGAENSRLYCFREDSLYDAEVGDGNLSNASKKMASTQVSIFRPSNKPGLNQQIDKKPVSPVRSLNQSNQLSQKSPDIAMPLTQTQLLGQKPLVNIRQNNNMLAQKTVLVASAVSDDQEEERSEHRAPPVEYQIPQDNIISFNPAPINTQAQGGGFISFNPQFGKDPEPPSFGRNFSFGEEKPNKPPYVMSIKGYKKRLSSASVTRLGENSKKVKKFIEQTSLIANELQQNALKVEPKAFLAEDIEDLAKSFKEMKYIESNNKVIGSMKTIDEEIKALKQEFQARFTQITTLIEYCSQSFKVAKKKDQLSSLEKKAMSKINQVKNKGDRMKKQCEQLIQSIMKLESIQTNT